MVRRNVLPSAATGINSDLMISSAANCFVLGFFLALNVSQKILIIRFTQIKMSQIIVAHQ